MRNDISRLSRLARLVSPRATLYAVGGYVRDKLTGRESDDIDICSQLTVDELKSVLEHSEFAVCDVNLRVGTVIVKSEDFKAEYACFRSDSYPDGSGRHTPDSVRFTKDIREDALRRDFTVNALYLNPLTGEILAPAGHRDDIEKGILRAVRDPDEVFGEDGLRLLRLVRFHAVTGFLTDGETKRAAIANKDKILDIAPERILKELDAVFTADTVRADKDAHFRGILMLDELGLTERLLPELYALKGLQQPTKYHIYDAYRHSLEAYRVCPPHLRWAALLHDIGKAETMRLQGNMYGHAQAGADMAKRIFERLRFPSKRAAEAVKLISLHMIDINGDMSENKLRKLIVGNVGVIDSLIDLKDADCFASCGKECTDNRIRRVYERMREEGVPFSIKELPVSGEDMIEAGVPEEMRGRLMRALLADTACDVRLKDRERALQYIERRKREWMR